MKWGDGMRPIDADELCEGRVENDPVRIAAMCAPTIEAVPVENIKRIVERLEEASFLTEQTFDEDGYGNDDSWEAVWLDEAIEIVIEEGGLSE